MDPFEVTEVLRIYLKDFNSKCQNQATISLVWNHWLPKKSVKKAFPKHLHS